MQLKSFLKEDKDRFILHSQYHGCWWPGNTRSQGISSVVLTQLCQNIPVSAREGLTLASYLQTVLFGWICFWHASVIFLHQDLRELVPLYTKYLLCLAVHLIRQLPSVSFEMAACIIFINQCLSASWVSGLMCCNLPIPKIAAPIHSQKS